MKLPFAILVIGLVARADGSAALSLPIQNALTSIDRVPTELELDAIFVDHQDALSNLSAIAQDSTADTGIRLRAIDALTNYCAALPCTAGDTAHEALTALVTQNAQALSGSDVVMLRGAIEALGPQRVGTDLDQLVPLLDHPSRDIRAATAHALRDLCNTQAINPLRVRYSSESTE